MRKIFIWLPLICFASGAILIVMDTPLRKARRDTGRSLNEVAEAVGTDPSNLSRIERGDHAPSTELAARLASYYGHRVTEMQILYPDRYGNELKGNSKKAVA